MSEIDRQAWQSRDWSRIGRGPVEWPVGQCLEFFWILSFANLCFLLWVLSRWAQLLSLLVPLLCYLLARRLSNHRVCFVLSSTVPRLLRLSVLAFQIGIEIPAEIPRRVIEAKLLVNRTQLVQVLFLQLEVPSQVAPDPLGRLALRQHAVSLGYPPRQSNLRAVLAVFLGNLDDGRIFDELSNVLTGAVNLVLVAEWAILLYVDAFALVECGECLLLEPGVAFDLVSCGDDSCLFEEALELCFAEVGDADCLCLAALERFLHSLPRVNIVGVARFDLVVFLGHQGIASGEGGGPVHEVEV